MIFLMDNFNTLVFFGVMVGDFARIVSGTVVNEDDFETVVGLGEDGIEAGGEVFCGIINWDDDGNFSAGELGSVDVIFGGSGAAENQLIVEEIV